MKILRGQLRIQLKEKGEVLAEIRLEDLKKSKSDKSLSNKSSSISLTSNCSEASIVAEERNNLEFEKLTETIESISTEKVKLNKT